MDKQEIVRKLLSRGIMVAPETLEKMKGTETDESLAKKYEAAAGGIDTTDKGKLKCTLRAPEAQERITPDDAVRRNAQRFERLKSIFLGRTDAVSIRNLGRTTAKICIVGQVRENKRDGFMLEDTTGEIAVKAQEKAETGDVIAVKGWIRENVLFADDIVYPDIPINREINVMDGSVLLASERGIDDVPADVTLTPDTLSGSGKERRMPNPAWVFLERGGAKITLLIYRTAESIDREKALSWLRRRYIGTEKGPLPNNDMVLDHVPDILWLISENEPWTVNYKGVTVISFGRRKKSLVDLKTRKVQIM
jgi:hypothetical protein